MKIIIKTTTNIKNKEDINQNNFIDRKEVSFLEESLVLIKKYNCMSISLVLGS